MMNRPFSVVRLPGAVVFALILHGAAEADAYTAGEIQMLLGQLGAAADEDLQGNLADPDLLPVSALHKARLYWDTRTDLFAAGSMGVPAPVGVSAALALRRLQQQGVQFTETNTVRRLFNALDSWNARTTSGKFADAMAEATQLVWSAAREQNIAVPSSSFIWAQLEVRPELRDMFIAFEGSRDLPPYEVHRDWPDPGEIWCYDTYKAKRVPEGILCYDSGDACWWPRPCPMPTSTTVQYPSLDRN